MALLYQERDVEGTNAKCKNTPVATRKDMSSHRTKEQYQEIEIQMLCYPIVLCPHQLVASACQWRARRSKQTQQACASSFPNKAT
jgi:hypothetical protein